MKMLRDIERGLESHEPDRISAEGRDEASVAVVLREISGQPEVMFIERAHREGDPWSGHMAFPGGRRDPQDSSSLAAAVRETSEEVGVSLRNARYLGLLGELTGRPTRPSGGLVVSAHIFHLDEPSRFVLNHEVREAFWFPVPELLDEQRHIDYSHVHTGDARYPGILVGEPQRHVVWGLTYRFLEIFLRAAGRPLPQRWMEAELERWARPESTD